MQLADRNSAQSADSAATLSEFDLRYYGWRVVLAACFGVMAGFGSLFVYTFNVFVKPLSAAFGWNREAISLGFGLAAITLGLISPLLGRWIDRFGPRRIILPCMTVFGCAIISLSLLHSHLWQFYVTCILLGLVGNGAAHLAYSRSISTWFQQRLGTALAFVMVGAGLGAMILPVVAQAVISRSDWRAAYLSLGVLALLLGLPLSWRYIVDRDADRKESAPLVRAGMTWQQGLRSFAFWIIVAVLFVSSISMNGAITHLSALLTDRGITPGNAALCASLLGGSSVLGRVGVGWLLDHFFGARVALVISLITATGIFLLAHASSFPAGCLAAALIGDSLFWAARFFHALRPNLVVLRRRGSHWSRDTGTRLRLDGLLYVFARCSRRGVSAGCCYESIAPQILGLLRNGPRLIEISKRPPQRAVA
jgi:predicted MFS family arabinose efflux permease